MSFWPITFVWPTKFSSLSDHESLKKDIRFVRAFVRTGNDLHHLRHQFANNLSRAASTSNRVGDPPG